MLDKIIPFLICVVDDLKPGVSKSLVLFVRKILKKRPKNLSGLFPPIVGDELGDSDAVSVIDSGLRWYVVDDVVVSWRWFHIFRFILIIIDRVRVKSNGLRLFVDDDVVVSWRWFFRFWFIVVLIDRVRV